MPFFLPDHAAAPLHVPNTQGTIAMGSFVVIRGTVCRVLSCVGFNQQFHCHRFNPLNSPKHSPTVSGIGKNVQELVWDGSLNQGQVEDIEEIAFVFHNASLNDFAPGEGTSYMLCCPPSTICYVFY